MTDTPKGNPHCKTGGKVDLKGMGFNPNWRDHARLGPTKGLTSGHDNSAIGYEADGVKAEYDPTLTVERDPISGKGITVAYGHNNVFIDFEARDKRKRWRNILLAVIAVIFIAISQLFF